MRLTATSHELHGLFGHTLDKELTTLPWKPYSSLPLYTVRCRYLALEHNSENQELLLGIFSDQWCYTFTLTVRLHRPGVRGRKKPRYDLVVEHFCVRDGLVYDSQGRYSELTVSEYTTHLGTCSTKLQRCMVCFEEGGVPDGLDSTADKQDVEHCLLCVTKQLELLQPFTTTASSLA